MGLSGSFAAFLLLLLIPFIICVAPSTHADNKNTQSLSNWLRLMRSKRQDTYSDSEKMWTLNDALPGTPDKDYPILAEIPNTDFSCLEKSEGYYADIGARCQVFRVCANTADDTSKGFGFLCPNGTLFNQEYFVCDWYMNVDCANSEKFYSLNEQIGTSNGLSMTDYMNQARDMISFPKQQTSNNKPGSGPNSVLGGNGGGGGKNIPNINNNRGPNSNSPSRIDAINNLPDGNLPSRGSANLGQPTNGNYPYSSPSTGGNGILPQRGANGGTIYVNSLGQLSTDKDSGFDERHSFILRPDKDSTFDQDFRVPSNSFESLKGIGNSYSFGIPGNIPLRGSEDLSEPVDPAEFKQFTKDRYLPPTRTQNNVPKQIYTYPNDATRNGQQISPEYTGQINTKLSANVPKFQAPQVYGPAVISHGFPGSNNHRLPPADIQQSNQQRPPNVKSQKQQQQKQQQQRKLAQLPPNFNAQNSPPIKLYQQPVQQLAARQPPQPFRPKGQQQQQQQIDRRNFNINSQKNSQQSSHTSRTTVNNNGNQSNESFLRTLLKDMTHIHNDKSKLIELIQRLFVPASTNMKVVSADVYPSQPSASYEFTYNDNSSAASQTHQLSHQKSGNCGGH